MKKLYYLIINAIGSLLSVLAAVMIIAYEKGKATADEIKAHIVKLK
jgi:uncharacterized membrane protein